MTPPHLTADLPAPRDDEPASLRQDIADELADHLSCAVRREELVGWAVPTNERGNDPDRWAQPTLHERVLARFGDPRSVARRLWWDAMRERIMKERLLTGLTLVAVLACCAMAGLMWQMQNAQRDMLRESQAQNAKLMEQFQAAIGTLQTGAASANDQRIPDAAPAGMASASQSGWGNVSLRLVSADDTNTPVNGAATLIKKVVYKDGAELTRWDPVTSRVPADASGTIDLGRVPVGEYRLEVQCDVTQLRTSNEIKVFPDGYQELVHCPMELPDTGDVTFDFKFPPMFKDVMFTVEVEHEPQKVNGRWWSSEKYVRLLVRGDSTLLGRVSDVRRLGGQDEAMENFYIAEDENGMVPFADIIEYSCGNLELPAGKYRGRNLRAYLPGRIQKERGSQLICNESGWEVIGHLKFEIAAGQKNAWRLPAWDHFLDPIARRLVRFGLRPVPDGLTVVKYHAPRSFRPVDSYPDGQVPRFKSADGRPLNTPGNRVDVYVAEGHAPEASTPRTLLLENVEYFFTEPSDSKLWAEGGEIDWIVSLLVAPEAVPIVERAAKDNTLELAPHAGNAGNDWGRIVTAGLPNQVQQSDSNSESGENSR